MAGRILKCAVGSYPLHGYGATFHYVSDLDGAPGVYSLHGYPVAFHYVPDLDAAPGVYTMHGHGAAFHYVSDLDASPGKYRISGHPAKCLRRLVVSTQNAGIYSMTGQAEKWKESWDENMPPAGGSAPKDASIHPGEFELYRGSMYGRGVHAVVPPAAMAHGNLTTTRYPTSRPVVIPA